VWLAGCKASQMCASFSLNLRSFHDILPRHSMMAFHDATTFKGHNICAGDKFADKHDIVWLPSLPAIEAATTKDCQ